MQGCIQENKDRKTFTLFSPSPSARPQGCIQEYKDRNSVNSTRSSGAALSRRAASRRTRIETGMEGDSP
jgi:hypothetical protein